MKSESVNKQIGDSRVLCLGVGLVSLALMHTQVVLTRLFSVVVWYHFAFFAISVALLGLSASALCVQLFQARLARYEVPKVLASAALLFALSILGLSFTLLHATPDWFGAGEATFFTSFTPKLLLIFCATTAPFFLGGFAISLAINRWPSAIHRIYAYDLGGAALACAIVIPVLSYVGGPDALVVSACLACVGAMVFSCMELSTRGLRRMGWFAASGLVMLLGVGASRAGAFEIRVAKGLDLTRVAPEFNRWNSFSLISVFPSWQFRGWGLSPKYDKPVPPEKSLVIDMNAFTPLLAFDGDFSKVAHTRYDLSALAYRIHPMNHACVIGAGGGKDVLAALASGVKKVTAVEVNPLIANDVMRDRYRTFNGGLYDRPDVELHVEDGRSFVRGVRDAYDVILISMVDTSAATAAGAYALAENGLYTVDAFRDFIAKLKPRGVLTVSSVSLPGLAVGARLAALAREALRERGSDPERSVAVIGTQWLAVHDATMYNVLVKPDGFDDAEIAALSELSTNLGFEPAYLPGKELESAQAPERAKIARILHESDDAKLAQARDAWPMDVSPVYDDRPYFFYQNRLRDSWQALWARSDVHLFGNGLVVLLKVLFVSLLMVAICIVLPLMVLSRKRRLAGDTSKRASWDIAFVACLGLGYMFVEMACVQRLLLYLGTPTYALTAVLLVLLLAGGFGSRAAAGCSPRQVGKLMLGLVLYAALWMTIWPVLAAHTAHLAVSGRVTIAGLSMLPLGFLMGIPLPSGLTIVSRRDHDRTAWLWGVNGATSVFGSVLATLGSMHVGIRMVLGFGILLYVCAAVIWPRLSAARSSST